MNLLNKAIVLRYEASAGAALRALLGDDSTPYVRFWAGIAPSGTALPFVRFNIIPLDTSHSALKATGATRYIETVTGQFSIFVNEYQHDQAWSIRDALVKLFDDHRPNFGTGAASGHVISALRTGSGRLINDPESGYNLVVEYRYVLEEIL